MRKMRECSQQRLEVKKKYNNYSDKMNLYFEMNEVLLFLASSLSTLSL